MKFSNQVEAWLKSDRPKDFAALNELFGAKSFAISIMMLMFIPALPLPTGGITHVFELITILIAFEMLLGLKAIWLPNRWQSLKLGSVMERRAVPMILRRIRWFEKRSSQRFNSAFHLPLFTRLNALIIINFTLAAFFAPPFSGLDTLPALGVVLTTLAIILEDLRLLILAYVVGAIGMVLVITAGAVTINIIRHFF